MSNQTFSHFVDKDGKEYELNFSEVQFMFSAGEIHWYKEVELGFDIPLTLVPANPLPKEDTKHLQVCSRCSCTVWHVYRFNIDDERHYCATCNTELGD